MQQHGNTLLHLAACGGATDVVALLIENGAVVTAKNEVRQSVCSHSPSRTRHAHTAA